MPGVVQGGSRTPSDPFVVYGFPVSLQGKLKPVHIQHRWWAGQSGSQALRTQSALSQTAECVSNMCFTQSSLSLRKTIFVGLGDPLLVNVDTA